MLRIGDVRCCVELVANDVRWSSRLVHTCRCTSVYFVRVGFDVTLGLRPFEVPN